MKNEPKQLKAILPEVIRSLAAKQGIQVPASRLPRVYLAGKIGKNDWRHEIVKGLRGAWGAYSGQDLTTLDPWPVLPEAVLDGRADYTGPYFVSCDHGCTHGEQTHGTSGGCTEPGDHMGRWEMRTWVFGECLRAIYRSDIVVAQVDQPDCYGTLFELGYAKALGKRILITSNGLDVDVRDDMWFAEEAADATYAVSALEVLTRELPEPVPAAQLDSEAERLVWEAYHAAKPPELTGLVTQHKALRYRIDMALPEKKIGFEIDGFAYHSDQETFIRDRKRHRELELAGWRIIRFSGKEACESPRQVVAEMARAAAAFIPKPTQAGDDQ